VNVAKTLFNVSIHAFSLNAKCDSSSSDRAAHVPACSVTMRRPPESPANLQPRSSSVIWSANGQGASRGRQSCDWSRSVSTFGGVDRGSVGEDSGKRRQLHFLAKLISNAQVFRLANSFSSFRAQSFEFVDKPQAHFLLLAAPFTSVEELCPCT
jgi:hypothetical protein